MTLIPVQYGHQGETERKWPGTGTLDLSKTSLPYQLFLIDSPPKKHVYSQKYFKYLVKQILKIVYDKANSILKGRGRCNIKNSSKLH